MIVKPDSYGVPLPGMREQANKIWAGYSAKRRYAGATQMHITNDFNTASNSLGACWTAEKCLGGRAWPTFQVNLNNIALCEKALILWMNTTLGFIGRWWVSSRQQPGRSIMSVTTLPNIPVINLQLMPEEKIQQMANLFDEYSSIKLQSAYLIDQDSVRQEIDYKLLIGILNLPETILESLQIIRLQWCSEQSVRGSKTNQ